MEDTANNNTQHSDDSASLKIVLLGPTGSGKTATANGILGREAFPELPTTVCVAQSGEVQGRNICVIDTPGLTNAAEMKREIQRSCTLGPSVPTVFLLFVDLTKKTEWKQYLQWVEQIFNKETLMYNMVLFTRSNQLTKEKFDQLLNNEETQYLIKKCGGGYHSLNSKTKLRRSQVRKLFEKIDGMKKTNRGQTPHDNKGNVSNVKIVLLGKTGVGKSATGNTILGREVFEDNHSFDSVTTTCQMKCSEVAGRKITVVDTPGLFGTRETVDFKKEIEKCIELSFPGPHAFLLVIRLDVRFTEEERNTVKWIQENFGERATQFTLVLFTYADKLKGKPLESKLNAELRFLIKDFRGRCHAFNNTERDDQTQMEELLKKIDIMVEENGGEYYTNKMYQDTQEKIRAEEERKKQEEEERKKQEEERKKQEEERKKQEDDEKIEEFRKKAEDAKRKMDEETKRANAAETKVICAAGVIVGAAAGATLAVVGVEGALENITSKVALGAGTGGIIGGGAVLIGQGLNKSGQRDEHLPKEKGGESAHVTETKAKQAEINISETLEGSRAVVGVYGGSEVKVDIETGTGEVLEEGGVTQVMKK